MSALYHEHIFFAAFRLFYRRVPFFPRARALRVLPPASRHHPALLLHWLAEHISFMPASSFSPSPHFIPAAWHLYRRSACTSPLPSFLLYLLLFLPSYALQQPHSFLYKHMSFLNKPLHNAASNTVLSNINKPHISSFLSYIFSIFCNTTHELLHIYSHISLMSLTSYIIWVSIYTPMSFA